ncbi:hypothetical protein VNO80_11901 [Phaseolus coccineus]|uniref:Uncharacterized protein n=1 Tax=Phaseolus coccineus TaxID=3886 RepID=A0AAN9NB16_PHACN
MEICVLRTLNSNTRVPIVGSIRTVLSESIESNRASLVLAASQLTGGDGELSQRFPITASFLFTRQRSSPLIFLFPLLPSLISALDIFFHVPLLLHFLFRSPFLLYPIFFSLIDETSSAEPIAPNLEIEMDEAATISVNDHFVF